MNPATFVLYCSELPGREAAARAELAKTDLRDVTFWRGFHGRTWGLETSFEYEPGKRLPPGHVGLNLGAHAMWQHALLTPTDRAYPDSNNPILLLEDDVVLPPDFVSELGKLEKELIADLPDWDLVLIGLAENTPGVWHKVTERLGGPRSRLCRMNDPFGTHAMLVRRRALGVMLEHMRAAERNLDQQLWARVLAPGRLKWAAVLPTLVRQRTFDYAGSGTPEWGPSTLRDDPGDAPPPPPEPTPFADPNGADPAGVAAMTDYVDPFPCIFRGEPLEDHGFRPGQRGSVPLLECARLNRPCHTRRDGAAVVAEGGAAAVACAGCSLRLSMAGPGARARLPIPDGHFNPSIAMWNDRLILATRDSWGHSKVALWELTNAAPDWTGEWAARPLGSHAAPHPDAPRLEDPRLFVAPAERSPDQGAPRLHAMFNLPDGYPPKKVSVGYARFTDELDRIDDVRVFSNQSGNLYEKNWVPFCNAGDYGISWVYGTKPEHTVFGGDGSTYRTPNPLPWTGGVIRGGAAPVLREITPPKRRFDNLRYAEDGSKVFPRPPKQRFYYHFFHGVIKRLQGSVYTVGCAVFEAEPPYRVVRQTPVPLLWPDLPAPGEDVVKRYVLFPGGAVAHAGAWFIACGVDDTYCRIHRLPFEVVESALDAPASDHPTVSLRDTKIAKGTHS